MTRIRHAGCVLIALLIAIAAVSAQDDLTALLEQAEQHLKASRTAEAQPLFERALDAAKQAGRDSDVARAYMGLAVLAQRAGRGLQGLATVKEALAIYERAGDQRGVALAAYQAAEWERQSADARPFYERSIAAARAIADPTLEGQSLHRLGDNAFTAGRYEESLQHLGRAAGAYETAATHGTDPSAARGDLGTVYNSLGRLYRAHGRLDEALKYQQAALALHRTSGNAFYLVQSLNAVAVVNERIGNFEAARAHWDEALKVAATLPDTNPVSARARDFLRANMAGLLAKIGDFAAAARALEEVIAAGRDVYPAERSAELSQLYIQLGRVNDAVSAADRAVALCKETVTCIRAFNARADARAAAGEGAAALADLSVTLQRLEELRGQLLPSDFLKQGFAAHYQHYYSSAIARQLDERLDRSALETAERARARAFLDLLASKAIAPPSPAAPVSLQGESGVASPATATAATADDLVRTAERLKSNLLLYWVGDTATVIWVVKPDGTVSARRVPVTRARLTALVRATAPFKSAAAAAPKVLNDSAAAWRQLYTLLVAPVLAQLPSAPGTLLTIVRHDVLSNLSFAALQDSRGRYLLEDFALHYAPTGGLFTFTAAQRRSESRTGPMLMVADPDTTARSILDAPLSRLPGARLEAAAITRQLAARHVLSLQGADATEAAVRAEAGSRSILHFAAHAIVDDGDPFAAYLALGGSADAGGDGRLTAQDVYGLNLSAELVVLSACKSANGLIAGDSVATFARAFTYAGAASLIASVWDVADEPSHQLLPAFYRAWLGGATKAAALRQAQLRVLSDLRGGRVKVTTALGPVAVPEHPVFWAGFVLFGEPD